MPTDPRNRTIAMFLVAYVVWVVLIALTHELNVASLVLGLLLAALVAWWGNKRIALREERDRSSGA